MRVGDIHTARKGNIIIARNGRARHQIVYCYGRARSVRRIKAHRIFSRGSARLRGRSVARRYRGDRVRGDIVAGYRHRRIVGRADGIAGARVQGHYHRLVNFYIRIVDRGQGNRSGLLRVGDIHTARKGNIIIARSGRARHQIVYCYGRARSVRRIKAHRIFSRGSARLRGRSVARRYRGHLPKPHASSQ